MICYGFLFVFACEAAQMAPVVGCPHIAKWSPAYQRQLAGELGAAGSATRRAMREHIQLRDRVRKCRQAGRVDADATADATADE